MRALSRVELVRVQRQRERSLSSAAASSSLKRSCSLAISSSSPRARSREIPIGGSVRVAMTRCDGARQVVEQEAHALVDAGSVTRW